jgi:hypothetical protein
MNVPLLDQKLIDLLTQLYPAAQRDYAKQQAAPVHRFRTQFPEAGQIAAGASVSTCFNAYLSNRRFIPQLV